MKINELLTAKIDEVFAEIQKRENIEHGDVDPMDEIELNELTSKMSNLIAKIIESQK